MKIVIQRVNAAKVSVDERIVGAITHGFLVLVGVGHDSTLEDAQWLARKTAQLRVFGSDKMNDALADVGGQVLAISQFTLYGDCKKGARPSFTKAAAPDHGDALYQAYCAALRAEGITVAEGIFGAHMIIDAQCDGPVTLTLERVQGHHIQQ